MGQTYQCNHCHQPCESPAETFIHIFSFHLRRDIGVDKVKAKPLLQEMAYYHPIEWETERN